MRLVLVGCLLATALAGCADAPHSPFSPPSEGPRTFVATYHVTGTDPAEDGIDYDLEVALGAPVHIMDAYESRREAYPLSFTRPISEDHDDEATYYIDGDLRIVRLDRSCGLMFRADGADCGLRRTASYLPQGFLPPWGMLWPATASTEGAQYVVNAQLVKTRLVEEEGWYGLPEDAPTPFGTYLEPENRYRYGNAPAIPEEIAWRSGFTGADVRATLVSFEAGDALPPIDAWRVEQRKQMPRLTFGFPGLEEIAFGSPVTWQDAFDALAQDPDAAAAIDGGCLSDFSATPYRDPGALGTGLLAGHGVHFRADIVEGNETTRWKWSYREDLAGPSPAGQEVLPTGWTDPTGQSVAMPPFCRPPPDSGDISPMGVLEAAWRLPVDEAGYPCIVRMADNPHGNLATGTQRRDAVLGVMFIEGAQGNSVPSEYHAEHHASQSILTGGWATFSLPEGDMARLDAGDWQPRPLPDGWPQPDAACVGPDGEGIPP